MGFKMKGYSYPGVSPVKTKLGRWLMGRKKETLEDGSEVITDRRGNVVKHTDNIGNKTKYKKGNRPSELYTDTGQKIY